MSRRTELDGEVWSKVVGAIRYNAPGNDYETQSAHQDAKASEIATDIIALVRQDERRRIREQLLSDEAVADMFYEAITLAHGEGEALGASRFKNAQCPECARQKEDEDIVAYRREGRTPPVLAQHVVPMVGFGIADRKQLATEFAARAAIGLTEEGTENE